MRLFTITIGQRGAPRITLEAAAPDAFKAYEQHVDMALPDERVEITPVLTEAEKLAADVARNKGKARRFHERNDRCALELQVRDMRCAGAL